MNRTGPGSIAPPREPSAEEVAGVTALGLFERRLARGGERPMVHYRGATLAASTVDTLSDAVARALQERGVHAGDRVAILLQNDPQFPICQLGVWKAGAIVVSLSPLLRSVELEHQLADTGCDILICLDEHADHALPAARAAGVRHVAVTGADDLVGGATTAGAAEPLTEWLLSGRGLSPVAVSPDDIALILFTSGTTGRSKGACISHANLVWSAHVYRDWIDLHDETVVMGAAPLFHATGQVAHLALADLLGAPLILDHRFDATAVLKLVERHDATFIVAAVTAFQALLSARDRAPRGLRRLVSGAQPIPPVLVDEVERWSGCYLQNVYGMTETTSPSHAVPFGHRAPVDSASGALAVGVPVTGTASAVVDPETGERLPVGEPGEIVVRGPQIVRGYWRRPDADAAAFRDGWLRTGDLGVVDDAGWFYVIDRIKDLINVSGFKVAPREVEDVLQEHPRVRAAAVVGVGDAYRGETVKAFVVPRAGSQVDPDELIEYCRKRLAAYKRPRLVEVVAELPQTASGKLLRRQLRD